MSLHASRGGVLFAVVMASTGCRRATPSPEPADGAASVAVVRRAVDAGGSARSAGDAGASASPSEREALARYRLALREGRSATVARRFVDARSAFDRALAARPGDARAFAERGHAALLAGDLDAAEADLARAAKGALEPKLAAAVRFNQGLVLEKRGRVDDARAAFVLADRLESTPARRAKAHEAGAACSAEISVRPERDVKAYAGWAELAAAVSPILDRGDAKKSVCIRSFSATGEPEADDVCDGPAPWVLFHNRQWFTQDEWIVVPSGGKLVAVSVGRVGSWPARCTNVPAVEASLDSGFLRLVTDFDGTASSYDDTRSANEETGFPDCVDGVAWHEETWVDPRTQRAVLSVRTLPKAPAPSVKVTASALVVSGLGCDRTVPLAP